MLELTVFLVHDQLRSNEVIDLYRENLVSCRLPGPGSGLWASQTAAVRTQHPLFSRAPCAPAAMQSPGGGGTWCPRNVLREQRSFLVGGIKISQRFKTELVKLSIQVKVVGSKTLQVSPPSHPRGRGRRRWWCCPSRALRWRQSGRPSPSWREARR